jgi:fibronectin type 3 domain-containing protein
VSRSNLQPARPSRCPKSRRPQFEELESRLLPSANLIQDPNFENEPLGALGPSSKPWGGEEPGGQSVIMQGVGPHGNITKFDRLNGDNSQLFQFVDLKADTSYVLTYWISGTPGATLIPIIHTFLGDDPDGDGDANNDHDAGIAAATVNTGSGGWHQESMTFNSGPFSAVDILFNGPNGMDLNITEISLTEGGGAPRNSDLTGTAGDGQVNLQWTPYPGASSYDIYKGDATQGNRPTYYTTVDGSTTSFTDNNVTNGDEYIYTVSNSYQNVYLTPKPGVDTDSPQLITPAQVLGSGTDNNGFATMYLNVHALDPDDGEPVTGGIGDPTTPITYSWTATGPAAVGFNVNFNTNAQNTRATFYQDGNYTLTCTMTDSAGNSITSSVDVSVGVTVPDVPANVVATAGDSQVTLNWDASARADSYNIYKGTSSGGESLLASGVTGTSFTDSSVSDDTTYFYFVTAVNSAGESDASAEVSATPTVITSVPNAPANLSANAGDGQVTLTWDASAGADSYNIYQGTSTGSESLLASGVTGTSFTDFSVSNDTTYFYLVTAVNSAGESDASAEVSATPGANAVTLNDTADSYVRAGIYADTNFGTDSQLLVKKAGTVDNNRMTYLKFDISTLDSVNNATLQLYGNIGGPVSGNPVAVAVYGVADSNWTDAGITWNNKPALDSTALASANIATDNTPRWYSFDVTSYIQAAKAAGATTVSLALQMTTHTGDGVAFNASEAGSNTPQLVVTPGPQSSLVTNVQVTDAPTGQTTYPTFTATEGALLYNDRSYTIASLDSTLQGGTLIQTANSDKRDANSSYLSFSVSQPVTVYVAYSTSQISGLPSWLSDWTQTDLTFTWSDNAGSLTNTVFAKSFAAGTVTLGGNLNGSLSADPGSNYVVIVQPA